MRVPIEQELEELDDVADAPRTVVQRLGGTLTAIAAVLVGSLLGLAAVVVARLIGSLAF